MEITIPKSVPTYNITFKVNDLYLIINTMYVDNKISEEDRNKLTEAVGKIHDEIYISWRAKRDTADALFKLANILYND